jgi:hypothetical protein
MRIQRGLPYGLTLIALFGLAFAGWTHSNPASAQGDAGNPVPPPPGGRMMMMGGPTTVAASGDYVYVVRGGTLYQLKASDLSIAAQKDLPAPNLPAPPPPGAGQ